MKRRDLFKITGAAAAVAGAGAGPAALAAAESPAAAPAWKPQVLSSHQNETVIVLTDVIIPETDTPGAKAANVNRYIDLFLAEGPANEKQQFTGGLGWIDRFANARHGHSFVRCSQDQQVALLQAMATGDDAAGKQVFELMKGATSRFYYNTAIGYRELNKGGRVPATFGCTHDGGHS